MSDTSKTPESKTYKPILYVHPFYPTFSIKSVEEGEAPKYQVRFNQAYVYDHQNDIIHPPIEISGMNSTFEIGDGAKKFYVSLSLDEGRAVNAALMETAGDVPASSEDAKYFLVCEIETDLTIKSFKLRENIHWGFSKPSVLTDLNQATYTKKIAKHNDGIKDSEDVDINETVTKIELSDNGFVYTDEEEEENEIPFPANTKSTLPPESPLPMEGRKIAEHNDGGANGGVTKRIYERVTTIELGSDGFIYTDEKGDENEIPFPATTKSVVTPEDLSPMDGHKIATHNDGGAGGGVDQDIDETVTTIEPHAGNSMSLSSDYFTYTDENGDATDVFFPAAGGGANYDGSDYIHVDNSANPPTIELANKNQATMKPVAGSVGFYEYYTVVAGALGHAAIYSTEPVAIGTSISQSSNTQETTGGTTT